MRKSGFLRVVWNRSEFAQVVIVFVVIEKNVVANVIIIVVGVQNHNIRIIIIVVVIIVVIVSHNDGVSCVQIIIIDHVIIIFSGSGRLGSFDAFGHRQRRHVCRPATWAFSLFLAKIVEACGAGAAKAFYAPFRFGHQDPQIHYRMKEAALCHIFRV